MASLTETSTATLSNEEILRYSRHLIMPEVTMEGQKKLKAARVLCVGTGGLGSPLALYLAAAGVGTLGLVDFDVVDYTNLQRQVLHYTSDVGRLKLDSAIDKLNAINPFVDIKRFDTYLNSQIAIARRYRRPLALVLCDIDAFKAFNDNYGHPAGDECLKKIAAALQTCCRRPSDMVARYGGEEFAIVLPDTDLAGAGRIAETARDAVAQLNVPHAHSPAAAYVSISGGVAVALRDAENAEQLIAVADKALYDAKHQGRNRVVRAQVEVANLPREGKAFSGKPWSCPNQA